MAKQDNESANQGDGKSARAAGDGKTASGAQQGPSAPEAKAGATAQPAPSDGVALLRADHRKVEGLFSQYEAASNDGQKQTLIRQICSELIIHTTLEEEIFYPACRAAASDEDPLDEAQVEHDSAKVLIADLLNGASDDPYRDAKVSVLADQIKHHVEEEEAPSIGIFARAQAAGVNKPELAQQLHTRKQALQRRAEALEPSRPVSLERLSRFFTGPRQEETMARNQNSPDRDDRGRFSSDDERRSARSSGGGRGRYDDDDDRGYRSRGGRDDDDGRGWYGDSERHAEAARRGWAERQGESRSFARSRDDDDDRRYSSRGSDRDERGRFAGDDDRYQSRGRYGRDDDDDRRYSSRSGSDRDRDERGRFAYDEDDRYSSRDRSSRDDDDRRYGARSSTSDRDRDERRFTDDDDRGGRYRSQASRRDDDDDRRYSSRGRDDDDRDRGRSSGQRGHGGWFGDSRGHSEAARRGWENR